MSQSLSDDTIYTRATNTKGFSANVRVSYPPDVTEAVSALVASGQSPYKTAADFHRDASQHRLLYWQGKIADPNYERKASISDRVAAAESGVAMTRNEEALLETRRSQLLAAIRDPDEIRRIVDEMDDDVGVVVLSYVRDGLVSLIDQYR